MSRLILPYWNAEVDPCAIALWLNGEPYQNNKNFCERVRFWQSQFAAEDKSAVLFYMQNTPDAIAAFTGLLASGHAILLADPALPDPAMLLLEASYEPHWILKDSSNGLVATRTESAHYEIHPDLALLMSTSGSTGSPKYVRLSHTNVLKNASAIAEVLNISSRDVAAAHLDFHYSYGLSVLTSHLVCGAGLSLTTGKFTDKEFWRAMNAAPVSHLPGVPVNYQIMHRLGMHRLTMPYVTTMTQAGGRLSQDIKDAAHSYMSSKGGKFYVMYGQTEASPRMSTLPHEAYEAKSESVGLPLPESRFSILDKSGCTVAPGVDGRVIYQGPNVMMGYAMNHHDLEKGDTQSGLLETGDIGNLDDEGYLSITGRHSRMGKVYGWRVSLDEIENLLSASQECAVVQHNDSIAIAVVGVSPAKLDSSEQISLKILEQHYPLPAHCYQFYAVPELPLTARNKTDYVQLANQIQLEVDQL